MDWLNENYITLILVLGTVGFVTYVIARIWVAATPTTADDEALAKASADIGKLLKIVVKFFGLDPTQGRKK